MTVVIQIFQRQTRDWSVYPINLPDLQVNSFPDRLLIFTASSMADPVKSVINLMPVNDDV